MTFQIGFVLVVVLLMIIGLVFELARPDMIVFMTMAVFLLTGFLSVDDALKGFSNEGMLTIALLFIMAAAVEKSGLADQFIYKLLGSKFSSRWTLLKVLAPMTVLSGFLNNTPIVVTLTPILKKWCQDRGVSPSKVLLPLSYATILGGMMTLIGTSTNLVVQGMLIEQGLKGFSFFQLGIVGVPVAIIGLIYILTIGYRILPNHKVMTEAVAEQSREYLAEVVVLNTFPYINKTIAEAGLRNLEGLYLFEIVRNNERLSPVNSSTTILSGDRLIFTGLISTIAEIQRMKGLRLETGTELTLDDLKNKTTQLVEAVISHQSSLLYKRVKDTHFRSQFDAGVIAVHRNSERIKSKVGEIRLRAGDTLLLLCGPDFNNRVRRSNDFYITTPLNVPASVSRNKKKGWLSIIILLATILLVIFNVLPMFKAMVLAVGILILTKSLTPEEAKRSIQFNILLLIASAFGIGTTLLKSGTAAWLANGLIAIGSPFGTFAIILILYIITNVFTEIMTNNAAAVVMFPICIAIATQLHLNPLPLLIAITIAASASFATPIGYQTNLIVYGPGGYKFKDYLKIGLPLNFIVMVVTMIIINFVWLH